MISIFIFSYLRLHCPALRAFGVAGWARVSGKNLFSYFCR